MMALGAIANAARVGARAGAVTAGTYSDITSSVQAALDGSSVGGGAQVVVTVNGRKVANARVAPSVGTLLKWSARDRDRTMLYGAELSVTVP